MPLPELSPEGTGFPSWLSDGSINAMRPPSSVCLHPIRLKSLLVLSWACAGPVLGGDWPAWRGPAGTGVSPEQNLPLRWSATENIRWHVPLPDRGNSTPIIAGGKIFVTQAVRGTGRRLL